MSSRSWNQAQKLPLEFNMTLTHWVSFGGGVGFLPASGTVGSLWGVVWMWGLQVMGWAWFTWLLYALFCAVLWHCVLVTYLACGKIDHKAIVADEIVGMSCALLGHEWSWSVVLAAFVWFRFWDISKWGLVGRAERLPWGGHAVMLDDVAAGGLANLCVWIGLLFQGGYGA